MRVLLASSLRGWGGGEEWFARAGCELAERGHDVRLAARRGSALARRAAERGLRVQEIDFGGDLDPRAILGLAALLRAHGTEVALGNLDKELTALAVASAAQPGLALVARRGSDFPVRDTALRRWLYRHRVHRVLVNSKGIAETLATGGLRLPRRRIRLLVNGLDPVPFGDAERERRAAAWPPGEGARLLAVGEVAERKNPLGVLAALAEVERPWRLLWLGEGPLRERASGEAERLGLAGHVRFAGAVPEARPYTAAADLSVHFSSSEGQPWAVLEALVQGVPVITSALPGLAGLVEDGVSGWAVAAGDPGALRAALEAALADPAERRRRAAEGARRARERHASGPVYDRLERLLEEAWFEARGHRRAIFVDRDGTLTAEVGALGRPAGLRLLPGAAAALRALERGGYPAIVVTNQAAVGRGRLRPEALRAVHAELRRQLRREGVELRGLFHCPHAPEAGCACRKPEPGLLLEAAAAFGLRLPESWMVGDSTRDVGAARRAGVPAIQVGTGWAGGDPAAPGEPGSGPAETAADLEAAAHRILARERPGSRPR